MFEYLYENFAAFIVPIHLLSTVLWIGGMVMFVFSVYPSLKQIPNQKQMIRTSFRVLKRFYNILIPAMVLQALSGVVMEYGRHYEEMDPTLVAIVGAKEAIWALMFMIAIFGYYKISDTKKKCLGDEPELAYDNIRLIAHYLFAISIFLGLFAIYFGLILERS